MTWSHPPCLLYICCMMYSSHSQQCLFMMVDQGLNWLEVSMLVQGCMNIKLLLTSSLHAQYQDNFIPKWSPHVRIWVNLYPTLYHSCNLSLVVLCLICPLVLSFLNFYSMGWFYTAFIIMQWCRPFYKDENTFCPKEWYKIYWCASCEQTSQLYLSQLQVSNKDLLFTMYCMAS